MFEKKSRAWLKERNLAYGISDEEIFAAQGSLTLTAGDLAEKLRLPVFIEGDLTVDGPVSIDDNQALIVTGTIRCESFWIGEGRCCAERLDVALVATFDCWGDDMHLFEVREMSAGVWCTVSPKPPGCLRKFAPTYMIVTSDLEEDKLLSWIVDVNPGAVCTALRHGEVVDDAWCLAHKELVKDPKLRSHLGL